MQEKVKKKKNNRKLEVKQTENKFLMKKQFWISKRKACIKQLSFVSDRVSCFDSRLFRAKRENQEENNRIEVERIESMCDRLNCTAKKHELNALIVAGNSLSTVSTS